MGADKNLSQSEAWLMIPKYTPNPNVLGEVRCSYGEAKPIPHRLIRRMDLNNVGSTDETEPAADKK